MNRVADPSENFAREAEHGTARNAASPPAFALSPRARQLGFWAAATITAANAVYLVALAWYASAGFAGPEPVLTRVLASLSVFPGAPGFAVLVAVLGSQYRPAVNTWARLSLVFAVIFAALAVMSRILQFVFLAGQGDPHLLDLYTARSLAQYAEFLAFGPFFGGALLFASRMFPSSGVARWARRLFALSGLLTFIGGSIFILLSLAGPSFSLSPQVGLLISLPAWVILYPAAIGLTAWLLWPGRATAQIGRARATWG